MPEPHAAAAASYYLARRADIAALFGEHSRSWRPFLQAQYGLPFAESVTEEACQEFDLIIAGLPYIGGDDNPMTRHLLRSTTSLALYKAMRARGESAHDTGHIVYQAVRLAVSRLPRQRFEGLSAAEAEAKRQEAALSAERRYPGDWVWQFVQGDDLCFDFGYDFIECGTHKLYAGHGACEFLPYYCYLDFVTHRMEGWGFFRPTTLAEGGDRCRFRYKRGGQTDAGWPPALAHEDHPR